MFRITYGRGFQITFENGITISVQFAYGNYCDNYFKHELLQNWDPGNQILSSENAEIAVISKDGALMTEYFVDNADDSVVGYKTVEEVFEIIDKIRAFKKPGKEEDL